MKRKNTGLPWGAWLIQGTGRPLRGPGETRHQAAMAWARGWLADGTGEREGKAGHGEEGVGASLTSGDTPGCHLKQGRREGEQVFQAERAAGRGFRSWPKRL